MRQYLFAISRQFTRDAELNELYASLAIRHFCLALISTFVPLYFIKVGFSLQQIFIYYAIVVSTQLIGIPVAAKFASRYGFKHSMMISSPLTVMFFVILYSINDVNWLLVSVAGVFCGLGNIFFRMGMHLNTAKNSHGSKRGTEIGTIKIVESIFKAVAPLIGGLILAFLNYQTLFLVVCVCLIASSIPLFLSKDYHEPIHFDMLKSLKNHKIHHTMSFLASGVEYDANSVVWPIAIFYILGGSYEKIGWLASTSLLIGVVVLFITGKWVNKNRKLVMKITSFGLVITWLFRSVTQSGIQLFALESVYNSLENGYYVAGDATIYDRSEVQGLMKYIFYYQVMLNLGRLIFFILLICIPHYEFGLLLGVIGSLVMNFA